MQSQYNNQSQKGILLVDRMSWKPNNNYDGQNNFNIETGAIEFFFLAATIAVIGVHFSSS